MAVIPNGTSDPRKSRRYRAAALRWIRARRGWPCALCGVEVNVDLPGTHPWGPTIEHTVPVRVLVATATSRANLLDLVCDEKTWALAHRRCQASQGARVTNRARQTQRGSRRW